MPGCGSAWTRRTEGEAVDHVLGGSGPREKPVIEEALQQAVQGVVLWVRQGIEKCMNQYNAGEQVSDRQRSSAVVLCRSKRATTHRAR